MAPWSAVWERNRFVEQRPRLEQVLRSPYARGGVSGVGAITTLAGLAELGSIFASRARRDTTPPA